MTTVSKNLPSSSTESLHARIPQETITKLDRIADSIGRSRNWVFNEALRQYLEIQQWQVELIKERLSQSEDKNAKFISHEEIMKRNEKHLKKKLGA